MTHNKTVLSIFTILLCLFVQVSFAQSFPKSVTTEMAKRETRYHHFLWHNVRDNWNLLSPDGQSALRQLGWAPPRPSRTYDSQGNAIALTDNNSGEDFLYMHRQMIAKVNSIIAQNNDPYGKVVGWKTLPAPGDKSWPVPSSYRVPGDPDTTQSIAFVKTSSFYYNNIRPMEKKFTDAAQLRKMTLGQLGSQIEMTVHNWLHIRFSGRSASGYRFDEDFIPDVDKAWDNPQYNWLADTYSSHVNPIFWKLHGWVDDRIEDWRRANGLSSIRWKGTWTGGPMSSFSDVINRKEAAGSLRVPNQGGNQGDDNSDDVLVQVARIIAKEGVQSKFTDLVLLPDDPILVVGSVPVPAKAAPVQVKKSKRKTCRRR